MAVAARGFQLACRARLINPANLSPPLPFIISSTKCTHQIFRRTVQTQGSLGQSAPSAPPARKAVTVTSDDGRHKWADLSTREKAARSTQQSINFGLVVAAAVGAVCGTLPMSLLCF